MTFKERYATPDRHFVLNANNHYNFGSYIKNVNVSDKQLKPIKDKILNSELVNQETLVRHRNLAVHDYDKIDDMTLKQGAKWADAHIIPHLMKTVHENPEHPISLAVNRGLAGNKELKGDHLDKMIENPKNHPDIAWVNSHLEPHHIQKLLDQKSTTTNHELATGRTADAGKLTDSHYNQILDSIPEGYSSGVGRTIMDNIKNVNHIEFSPETLHKFIDKGGINHHVTIASRKEVQPDHIQRLLDMKNSRIDEQLAKNYNLTHAQKWELLHRGTGEGTNRQIHNNLILLNHLDPEQEDHIMKHGIQSNKEDLAFAKSLFK